jgi:transposase
VTRAGLASATTREVTCCTCTRPENLQDDQAAGLAAVLDRCEHLDRLTGHVRAFARLLTALAGEQLNAWIRAVADDTGQPQLMSFVRGVLADYDAVRAGLTLQHNSGPVEGNVTRIKMIKRKLYGRANFDLLRTLVVLDP